MKLFQNNGSPALRLSPAQQQSFDWFRHALPLGNLFVLWSSDGRGRTTVLNALQRETRGALLSMEEYMEALRGSNPHAMEETFEQMLLTALAGSEVVILDDLHLLTEVIAKCNMTFYQRNNLIHGSMVTLAAYAERTGKKRIVGADQGGCPSTLQDRSYSFSIPDFTIADYEFFGRTFMDRGSARIDWAKVHRFAPKLDAHQLRNACVWLKDQAPDTEGFVEYLRSQQMASNVDLGEVQAVDLRDLKGV